MCPIINYFLIFKINSFLILLNNTDKKTYFFKKNPKKLVMFIFVA